MIFISKLWIVMAPRLLVDWVWSAGEWSLLMISFFFFPFWGAVENWEYGINYRVLEEFPRNSHLIFLLHEFSKDFENRPPLSMGKKRRKRIHRNLTGVGGIINSKVSAYVDSSNSHSLNCGAYIVRILPSALMGKQHIWEVLLLLPKWSIKSTFLGNYYGFSSFYH